jgi:hypothetical protein
MPDDEPALPISGGEITAARRAFSLLREVLKRPDPQRVVQHRAIVKRELRKQLNLPNWYDRSKKPYAPRVLVFRLGQNSYPDVVYRVFRPDDWSKLEVKGLHDRGLEVFTGIHEVTIDGRKARLVEHGKKPPKGIRRTVAIVGRIPYEWISHMDWDRENAEQLPVLHVGYGHKGPIREWVVCGLAEDDYSELPYVKLTARRKGWLSRARARRVLRRMDRQAEDEIVRLRSGSDDAES